MTVPELPLSTESSSTVPMAYLNGVMLPATSVSLPVWDRGVVQGVTVTEMLRTFRQVPFQVAAHLSRMRRSLEYLGVEITESDHHFVDIIQTLIESRIPRPAPPNATSAMWDETGIVLFVTPGAIPMYADGAELVGGPTVCVHTFRLPVEQWRRKYVLGQSLVVPSVMQIPREILDPRFKYRSRLHWYLADREAQSTDPGSVALLRNLDGHLTETNSGNFMIAQNGRIRTPHAQDTLPGISQQFVKELSQELEIPYEVGDITLSDALAAEEAFVSSTSYCLLPVTRLNCQPVGRGVPGPIWNALINRWSQRVGCDISNQ